MEELRRNHPCFDRNAYVTTWDTCSRPVFAIRRTTQDREMICLANFSGSGQKATLPTLTGTYRDLFTEEFVNPQEIWMAPYQYRWCVRI